MKFLKDKKIIILVTILVLFTIIYFVVVNKISYAFSNRYDLDGFYNTTMNTIKKCAIAYGEQNLELFENEKTIYIKVQDLIDNNYLVADESGVIKHPLNENETLNSNVIKLKYQNKEVTAEVHS